MVKRISVVCMCTLLVAAIVCLPSRAVSRAGAAPPQPLVLPAIAPTMDCAALGAVDVGARVGAKTRVVSAVIAHGPTAAPYCSVKVVVDDYARFEMHMPLGGWTQRMLFGGGPGAQTAEGTKLDQFVTISWDDLGRRGNEDVFASNYQYRINNGYRGMHLQVLAAKALIARYYGRGPRFSYYNACSNPGREGMIEAERFPEDFDGIAAGCPPINITFNNGLFYAWNVLKNTSPDGKPIITADKLPILHQAVLDQCDASDGVKDGIVSDPFACHPDFKAVECKGAEQKGCVTAAQIGVAKELYRGPHDAQGRKLAPSGVLPGSELAWTATIVPSGQPFGGPDEARAQTTTAIRSQYSYPALPRTWQLSAVKFDRATFDATTRLHYLYDATNPDLSGMEKRGHKLILWMSLADTNVLPAQAILYYTALQKRMGASSVARFARFYVLPGVYHCGGGDGPVIADVLQPLMVWVERGIAPQALHGAHVQRPDGRGPGSAPSAPAAPDLTRPIYPYPYTAKYVGSGNIREAANYVRGPARPAPASLGEWAGSKFYQLGHMKWCSVNVGTLTCRDER